ncbi:MAG: HAD family hydrolase [Oscillospiraceae bacterium]|nr:HAD family hydrolase [Oscillospiraceae bacterium]
MIKAVFMDFYGTVTHENGPIAMEVVQKIYKTSSAESPEEVLRYWWTAFREKLQDANGEHFQTQHDIALRNFEDLLEHFDSSESPQKLLARMEEHWCTTAAYVDAKPFMEAVDCPVYFVTNSDDKYVFAAAEKNKLHPEGIITSEQARYSKPRKEIFLYALEKAGLHPSEVVHIGDSLIGDIEGAEQAGIKSIWLNRNGASVPFGVTSANGLDEVLTVLREMMKRC